MKNIRFKTPKHVYLNRVVNSPFEFLCSTKEKNQDYRNKGDRLFVIFDFCMYVCNCFFFVF